MRYILRSLGPGDGRNLGGKARCLLRLRQAGFPVPDFFMLPPQAFRDSLTPAQRNAVDSASDPETLRPAVGSRTVRSCPPRACRRPARVRARWGRVRRAPRRRTRMGRSTPLPVS